MAGMVYLVGIGLGENKSITPQAEMVLETSQVIIGHNDSIKLIERLIRGKEVIHIENNPVERSRVAVEKARLGQKVAIISVGDAGVYGIASTFLSYLRDNNVTLEVEIIPGVTIASSAAAKLGAPLGGNYVTISLSDESANSIDKKNKLELAAGADFVFVFYNLLSKRSTHHLQKALKIISDYRVADTPIGLVKGFGTSEEKVFITTLKEINFNDVTIDTIAIVGNSQTFVVNGKMVTK
jgi:precorrin-3B C17-methyltransferase